MFFKESLYGWFQICLYSYLSIFCFRIHTMMEILGRNQSEPAVNFEKLFDAGIQFMGCGEYAYAYLCFQRSGKKDCITLYNQALCCYMVSWADECYNLLRDAERLIPASLSVELRELPGCLVQWEYNESPVFIPLPCNTPLVIVAIRLLRLKAETAYKLRLFNEVRAIASHLGNKYMHINNLLNKIEP